jgi:hypothetical protein
MVWDRFVCLLGLFVGMLFFWEIVCSAELGAGMCAGLGVACGLGIDSLELLFLLDCLRADRYWLQKSKHSWCSRSHWCPFTST